ncbi:MAG: hypothetical protein ABWY77_01860 [Acidimicrobiia bacterium]
MRLPDDPGLLAVLAALDVNAEACLGHGGEAWVYALDGDRIVRVLHDGHERSHVERRRELLAELTDAGAEIDLPWVLDVGHVGDRWYTVECRYVGDTLLQQLPRLDGAARDRLVEHHLHVAARLAALPLDRRGWFGDLIVDDPVRADTWRGYLRQRAAQRLELAPPSFHGVDADALATDMDDCTEPVFVHLDAFAGNMLAVGTRVTAVLDVGVTAVSGASYLDPVAAAVYLATPEITPIVIDRDVDVALAWLRNAGLADHYEPTRRWLAAFWCPFTSDTPLHRWCRAVLLEGTGTLER